MSLNRVIEKLKYLLTVGYRQEIINSFEDYCIREVFDEDSVVDDLEELEDSSIMEHLQQIYKWNDEEIISFYLKLRQSLNIDKINKQDIEEKKEITTNNNNDNNNKLYISAYQIDYNLTEKEFNFHKEIYFNQCNRLLPLDQRSADAALLYVLAIGRKNSIPLLQNITDTYSRVRINKYLSNNKNDLKESEFVLENNFFKKMKRRNQKQSVEYLQHALQSFHRRICPKIQFKSLLKINDSLAIFFEYVSATIKFIYNIINQKDALPPFMVDLWIIPSHIKSAMTYTTQKFDIDNESNSNTDDDSDYDDDDDSDYSNNNNNNNNSEQLIGNIESRLQFEKLVYNKNNIKSTSRFERELDKKCKDFWEKNKKYNENNNQTNNQNKDRTGAHKTRICICIDRRKPKDFQTNNPNKKTWDDQMYIYSPPSNCNYIVDNHTPELFFNLSKECLLPGKGYNNGKRDEIIINTNVKDNNNKKKKKKEVLTDFDLEDITVGKPLGGYQFTISFHIQSIDNIKAYIFINGQITRFFPIDMITLWPIYFDQQKKENREFINNTKKWKSRIDTLSEMLCDEQFKQWYKETVTFDTK